VNQSIGFYHERLFQETGRFSAWPLVIALISRHPIEGYGVLSLQYILYVPGRAIQTPHNGILYLWLTSGAAPLIPFFALWTESFRRGLRMPPVGYLDPLPLLTYAFLQMLGANSFFVALWSVATFFYLYSIAGYDKCEPVSKPV
jgi:O-antigen ligase